MQIIYLRLPRKLQSQSTNILKNCSGCRAWNRERVSSPCAHGYDYRDQRKGRASHWVKQMKFILLTEKYGLETVHFFFSNMSIYCTVSGFLKHYLLGTMGMVRFIIRILLWYCENSHLDLVRRNVFYPERRSWNRMT